MRQHTMKPPRGARKTLRRLGRGIGSGRGKTAGKGTKGQLARSGRGITGWFEGGQTPIHMRIPKMRGFKNTRFRVSYVGVNVGRLGDYAVDGKVTPATLAAKGLVRPDARVKVLADGEVKAGYEVHTHAVSATARKKIESADGSYGIIGQ